MCELVHIPQRLHQADRNEIKEFYLEEEIYRRGKRDELEYPFAKITLADISVNRQGDPLSPLCEPHDVLFNTKDNEGENVPKYINEGFVVLKVKELLPNKTYIRTFKDHENTLELHLKHDPKPCNYPHAVFELVLNGVVVSFKEYKKTLQKHKELRDQCRDELQKMIIRRELVLSEFS